VRCLAVLVTTVCLFACGGDDGGGDGDLDVDAPVVDAPSEDSIGHDGHPDGLEPIRDAATDATMLDGPLTNLGPVDCRVEADCPGLSSCTVTAPGGVCNGCGTDNDCPTGTTCGEFGACVRDCTTDAQCSAGKECRPSSGLCAIRQCSVQPCPYPYVCNGINQCARPACGTGGTCPTPMTCGSGNICVEP
jgi:hypothetical protein